VTTLERFWSKVDRQAESDCWEWQADRQTTGYGRFTFDGKVRKAHRMAYALAVGPIPEGMQVLHRCDNPPCCNPAHLWLGTMKDNMADREAKGRTVPPPHRTGEAHPTSWLTWNTVNAIRSMAADGIRQKTIAQIFGLDFRHVNQIVLQKIWRQA
jgi:hypothetical protein